jgi:hypothetical protein
MYGDRCSAEFIEGVRSFLKLAEANKQNGLCVVLAVRVEMRRITLAQAPFTST